MISVLNLHRQIPRSLTLDLRQVTALLSLFYVTCRPKSLRLLQLLLLKSADTDARSYYNVTVHMRNKGMFKWVQCPFQILEDLKWSMQEITWFTSSRWVEWAMNVVYDIPPPTERGY